MPASPSATLPGKPSCYGCGLDRLIFADADQGGQIRCPATGRGVAQPPNTKITVLAEGAPGGLECLAWTYRPMLSRAATTRSTPLGVEARPCARSGASMSPGRTSLS